MIIAIFALVIIVSFLSSAAYYRPRKSGSFRPRVLDHVRNANPPKPILHPHAEQRAEKMQKNRQKRRRKNRGKK